MMPRLISGFRRCQPDPCTASSLSAFHQCRQQQPLKVIAEGSLHRKCDPDSSCLVLSHSPVSPPETLPIMLWLPGDGSYPPLLFQPEGLHLFRFFLPLPLSAPSLNVVSEKPDLIILFTAGAHYHLFTILFISCNLSIFYLFSGLLSPHPP